MTEPALHRSNVLEAFDTVAPIFESEYENDITARIRESVYESIRRIVPRGSSILDINCGVGIDAVALAAEGYSVVGSDISPRMIEAAKARAKANGQAIRFYKEANNSLGATLKGSFDVVLSNFGGLNCSQDLRTIAGEVGALTKPGGYFIAIVMPPFSLWETLAGFARGDFKYAFRRFGGTQATGFNDNGFHVTYHRARILERAFRPWFVSRLLNGICVLSPPPHAFRFKARNPSLVRILNWLDASIAHLPGFRSWGDHYMIILQKEDLSTIVPK